MVPRIHSSWPSEPYARARRHGAHWSTSRSWRLILDIRRHYDMGISHRWFRYATRGWFRGVESFGHWAADFSHDYRPRIGRDANSPQEEGRTGGGDHQSDNQYYFISSTGPASR